MEFAAYVSDRHSLPEQSRIDVSRFRLPSQWRVQG
jgi:hypothetical protein